MPAPRGKPIRTARVSGSARAGIKTGAHDDMHAGEYETSVLLHCWPHPVQTRESAVEPAQRPFLLVRGLAAYSHTSAVRRPNRAKAAKGKAAPKATTGAMVVKVRSVPLI